MNWPIDKVFVSHWSPLTDRRSYLERAFQHFCIDADWVTQYDKRTLDPNTINSYYRPDQSLFIQRVSLDGHREGGQPYPLNPAEIANAITHIHFYKEIVRNGYESTLILEDDIIFTSDFVNQLSHYLSQLPEDWDILYPGSGCGLHMRQTDPRVNVYLHPLRGSRTADCYVIRKKAAEKILSTIIPFVLPIDWELNYHQWHHELQVYWGEPSIAAQGSEIGIYQTTSPKGTPE